jgi:hypothetical protein
MGESLKLSSLQQDGFSGMSETWRKTDVAGAVKVRHDYDLVLSV